MNKMIQFHDWGLTEYNEAWSRQEKYFKTNIDLKLRAQSTENYLIFCEHPHVYTLGKSGDEQNLLLDFIQLQAKDAQFIKSNRGGDITYHGPGQVVGYPIFDLANFNIGLKLYIFKLEEAIINTLAYYDIKSTRLEGATGVWIDVDMPSCRKICAIGVRSSHFITMHGFALNVNTNLNYFDYINPCGFVDKGVTSIQKELDKSISMSELKKILREELENCFQ